MSRNDGASGPLGGADLDTITAALSQAGIEVYRVVGAEVAIAERVRFHIMDSGVRVHTDDPMRVVLRARSQRSDYPHMSADELLGLVRASVGSPATANGFVEQATVSREIRDPTSQEQVLDVWHEVTYAKAAVSVQSMIDDVRWALQLDKYVTE